MVNLAAHNVTTICYYFMPLLDWIRADLAASVGNLRTCLRFDAVSMVAFEIYIMVRKDDEVNYPEAVISRTAVWFQQATKEDCDALLAAIMAGMPGASERYGIVGLKSGLSAYHGMDCDTLRANYKRFLDEVVPTAEDLGIRLCVHPDDPPRDVLGLPRIVSNVDDLE